MFSTTPQPFQGRKKTPSEHSCDSEPEPGSSGLSRLSVGINTKPGLRSSCVLSSADGMRCTAARRAHPCGEQGRVPQLPEPQGSSAQVTSAPLLCLSPTLPSSTTEAQLAVHRENGPAGEGLQSHRGHVLRCQRSPCAGDAPLSHGRSPALSADRCGFASGLCDLLRQISQHPCASLSPQLPPRLLTTPFSEREPHVRPLRGAGSCCPAPPLKHPSFIVRVLQPHPRAVPRNPEPTLKHLSDTNTRSTRAPGVSEGRLGGTGVPAVLPESCGSAPKLLKPESRGERGGPDPKPAGLRCAPKHPKPRSRQEPPEAPAMVAERGLPPGQRSPGQRSASRRRFPWQCRRCRLPR